MEVKKSLNYRFEPEKYIFGMCEEFEGSLDAGADANVTVDLINALGAKSMRVWMHHKRLLKRKSGTNKLEWKPAVLARYHNYIDALVKSGTDVLAMNHNYVFPAEYDGDMLSVPEVPLPGSDCYLTQMKMLSEAYEMMAREFPEIVYWECGNEVNMHTYIAKPGFSAQKIGNQEYTEQYCYTNEEKARITADICYYSTLGVKKGNPSAFVVFPCPTPYRGYGEMAEFYRHIYAGIKSGSMPTGMPPDTNPDNYFQVQCWHAYNFGGDSQIIVKGANLIYNIMKDYGDGGKKVFISEFGYHDNDFVKNRGMTKRQADEKQASFLKADFEAFKSLGFVERVYVFRLYEWVYGPGIEVDFGLFTSPSAPEGIVPKAKGLELFNLFNPGGDIKRLYKYQKEKSAAPNAVLQKPDGACLTDSAVYAVALAYENAAAGEDSLYAALSEHCGDGAAVDMSQPPVLAWAAEKIYLHTISKRFLRKCGPLLEQYIGKYAKNNGGGFAAFIAAEYDCLARIFDELDDPSRAALYLKNFEREKAIIGGYAEAAREIDKRLGECVKNRTADAVTSMLKKN